jgi:amino acid transporter
MPRPQIVPAKDGITRALAKDRLGVPTVIFFVMSAAAPLTVVAGVLPTAYDVTGLTSIPIVFLTVGAVLALWSVGFVAMGRYLPHAGAFYAYVSHGLGRIPGVGAAWVSLLSYTALQVALYGGLGVIAAPLAKGHTGLDLPWWVFALMAWALVTVLGLFRVDLNGAVLSVLLVAEVVVIGIYDLSFAAQPAHGLDFSTFSPTKLIDSGTGALLAIAVLGFTGFETTVVFSEEARNPRRTIPIATFASVAFIAILYGISAWGMAVATGTDKIGAAAHAQGGNLVFGLASDRLGPFFGDLGNYLILTSMFAAMVSFHNTFARYVFALGREGVLPAVFGGTSSAGVPRAGSIAQSVIGLGFIVLYSTAGLDPWVQGFYTLGTIGGFGAIVLITWTSYAIVAHFRRHSYPEESIWRTVTAPLLAATIMTGMLVLAVANFATMLGVSPSDPLRWGVPVTFLLVALLGMLYGAWLRFARHPVYAAIGMGAKSTSTSLLATSLLAAGQERGMEAGR